MLDVKTFLGLVAVEGAYGKATLFATAGKEQSFSIRSRSKENYHFEMCQYIIIFRCGNLISFK